jgi:hypothetical protein
VEVVCIDPSLFGKRSAGLAVTVSALILSSIAAGCGGGDRVADTAPVAPAPAVTTPPTETTTTATTTTTTPTTTTPAATTPATTDTTPAPPSGGTAAPGAGDEGGIQVPARFTVAGGNVVPGTVDVPAFLPVTLTLVSGDGREHTLRIATPDGGVHLHVAASSTASRTIKGLPKGDYLVSVDGAATDATLHVG